VNRTNKPRKASSQKGCDVGGCEKYTSNKMPIIG